MWFSNLWLARATVVITNLWLALPFDILVLLAGLANLPQEPFEAAEVDGASSPQIFLRSTLPLLRPVIAIILVIRIADAFRVFDVVYVLTGGGPANKTDVLSTLIYRRMFSNFDFTGGAAASVLLVVITSLASLVIVLGIGARTGKLDDVLQISAPFAHRRYGRLCASCGRIAAICYSRLLDFLDFVEADARDPGDADDAAAAAADA